MNPIYTGKDVSFIDTKQANRAAEHAVLDAERFAVFAHLLTGAAYPEPALAKAWVQLAYGAHHDAITGSESDQVYLDLLTGWRDAWELGRVTRDAALRVLTGPADGKAVTVWNPLAHRRTDIVTVHLGEPVGPGVRVRDPDGAEVPVLVEDDGMTLTWLARAVPSLGWQTYRIDPGPAARGWDPITGTQITNAQYRIRVDPRRGGAVESLLRDGRKAGSATNSPSTRSTRRTPRRGRGRGICCPRGRWWCRRQPRPTCRPTAAPSANDWWCGAASTACCATPRR